MPLVAIAALPISSIGTELLSRFVPNLSINAASQAVTGLWQGMAITVGLALMLRMWPRVNASLRFVAWSAAFVTILLLPFFGYLRNFFSAALSPATSLVPIPSSPASALFHVAPFQVDLHWSFALAGLWLAASLTRAALLAADLLRLRRIWRSATPLQVQTAYPELLELPGRRTARICSTTELERPAVIGFFSPRILIPAWLINGVSGQLTTHELDQIVLHETEHLRRKDDWTNLLQKLALVLFPLNPALLFIDRRLSREREMASDEGVIRITQAPRAYAACLAGLAERSVEHRARLLALPAGALVLGAWRRRSELLDRVQSILSRRTSLHPALAAALVPLVALTLFGTSVELARCPQLVAFMPAENTSASRNAEPVVSDLPGPMAGEPTQPAVHAMNVSFTEPGIPAPTTELVRRPDAVHPLETRFFGHLGKGFANSPQPASSSQAAKRQPVDLYQPVAFDQRTVQIPTKSAPQAAAPAPQGWLVLTTWEQTITPSNSADRTDQPAVITSAEIDNQTQHAVAGSYPQKTRTRVTQLVFELRSQRSSDPASPPTDDFTTPNNRTTNNPTDSASRPSNRQVTQPARTALAAPRFWPTPATALIPTRNGWLVVQL